MHQGREARAQCRTGAPARACIENRPPEQERRSKAGARKQKENLGGFYEFDSSSYGADFSRYFLDQCYGLWVRSIDGLPTQKLIELIKHLHRLYVGHLDS